MRTALLLLAVLTGTAAAEEAAKRKTAPDKFTKAAGEAFVAATAADQKGDLPTALGLYQKAFAISPHPSTMFNIADVAIVAGVAGLLYDSFVMSRNDAVNRP